MDPGQKGPIEPGVMDWLTVRARRAWMLPTTILGWKKILRVLAACSGPVAFALLTLWFTMSQRHSHDQYASYAIPLYWAWFVGVGLWCVQSSLEYQRRTHDPKLAIQYQKLFDGTDMRRLKRPEAARALSEFRSGKLKFSNAADLQMLRDKVDDILDVFEDLGFLVQGGQVSPEVAHHFFDYWIQGYWRAAKPYIALERGEQPAEWNHLEYLARISQQVEYWVTLDKEERKREDFQEFLEEEIRLASESNGG